MDDGEPPLQSSCTTWTFLHVGRTPKTRIILFRGPLIKSWMGQFVKSERQRQHNQHELQSLSINTEEMRVVSKGALPALHPLLQSCTPRFSRNRHNHYFTCTICAKMNNLIIWHFWKLMKHLICAETGVPKANTAPATWPKMTHFQVSRFWSSTSLLTAVF